MRKGFGDLIANRRISIGMSPEELAGRLNRRSKSIVYRLESEEQEPDAEMINMLVASLPLSAEELLKAMGVNLSQPLAARLPRQLVEALVELTPEQHQTLLELARWTKGGGQR